MPDRDDDLFDLLRGPAGDGLRRDAEAARALQRRQALEAIAADEAALQAERRRLRDEQSQAYHDFDEADSECGSWLARRHQAQFRISEADGDLQRIARSEPERLAKRLRTMKPLDPPELRACERELLALKTRLEDSGLDRTRLGHDAWLEVRDLLSQLDLWRLSEPSPAPLCAALLRDELPRLEGMAKEAAVVQVRQEKPQQQPAEAAAAAH